MALETFGAEFVRCVGLALADALDLMGVQAINLAAVLALPLLEDRRGLVERPREEPLQPDIAGVPPASTRLGFS